MNTLRAHLRRSRPLALALLVVLGGVAATTITWAGTPLNPLPMPEYSFKRTSWAVQAGHCHAGDILALAFPHPAVLVPQCVLGLVSENDDLDALSAVNPALEDTDGFVLLISVDELTVGDAPPEPYFIDLNVPYNVADQASRGHAPGDQFMSSRVVTLASGPDTGPSNTVLTRNNFDEGGTDFAGQPPRSAYEYSAFEPVDIVNAMARLEHAGHEVVNICYSVTADSPSLETLPGYRFPSGADIYFRDMPPTSPPADPPAGVYATHAELSLVYEDDIDGLIVFDGNQNYSFDGTDAILFSLAPGSPSLTQIPGASAVAAAADVFMVTPGQPARLLVSAAELGLGHEEDNIDALDFALCDDALACGVQHGIRSPIGDLNCDGLFNGFDIRPFVMAVTDPGAYTAAYPDCHIEFGDLNGDGLVNNFDIRPFVDILLGG